MSTNQFEDTRTAAERNRDLALTAAAAIEGIQHGLPRVEGESQFWKTVTSEEVIELLIGATHLAMAKGLGDSDAVLRSVGNAVSGDVMAELNYAMKHKESGIRCPQCLARPKNQPGDPHPWYIACDGCRVDADSPSAPTTYGSLHCHPPITPAEWARFETAHGGSRQITLTDPSTITITGAGDPAELFAAVRALVAELRATPRDTWKDTGFTAPDGVTPFNAWRTFNGRVDSHSPDGTPTAWGVCGNDVVDLHFEAPEPLLDVLEEINRGTVDELRRTQEDGYEHHLHDLLDDLNGVLGEYHAGIAGAVSRQALFAGLPTGQEHTAACELERDALAAYTTGLLAEAIGIADAWQQRIAERAAERGLTRCDLSDPAAQAAALRTQI